MLFHWCVSPVLKRWERCVYPGLVLRTVNSAFQGSESGCWVINPLSVLHSTASLCGSCWLSFNSIEVVTYNFAGGGSHIFDGKIYHSTLKSGSPHNCRFYSKICFVFSMYGLHLYYICLQLLYDGGSRSGLWQTGCIYPRTNAGFEEWRRDIWNKRGQYSAWCKLHWILKKC